MIKANLTINPPAPSPLVSFTFKSLNLQSVPRVGEKISITVDKDLAEAFDLDAEDHPDIDLVVTSIKHDIDIDGDTHEHIIKVHTHLDPSHWGVTYGGQLTYTW